MFKETTAEDVIKIMRNDNKKLDDAMDELAQLTADLRKAEELIRNALLRYRKDKLKKKSLKKAAEDGDSRSAKVLKVIEKPEKFLSTIIV